MLVTAGSEQVDSPYHEARVRKRITMIQIALIGPAQQWYPRLPIEIKKRWPSFCRKPQKASDNQQSQTQAKIILESIPRSSGEQIKRLAHRFEQMARKNMLRTPQI